MLGRGAMVGRRRARGTLPVGPVGSRGCGRPVVATALLDRLLHHSIVIQIEGSSYRLRQHADLVPEHIRSEALIQPPAACTATARLAAQ
jgi:IstB-like ATP binding protein